MKKNALILTSLLYPLEKDEQFLFAEEKIELIFPRLTVAGRRSLVYQLTQRGDIFRENVAGTFYLSITNQGIESLKAQFPVFYLLDKQWDRKWQVIVFNEPPKGDKNFRYLRSFLTDHFALPLSRGVYLWPSVLFNWKEAEILKQYKNAVYVFSVDEWLWGLERPVIVSRYHMGSVVENWSGISKELSELLAKFEGKKELMYKNKENLHSVLNRWVTLLVEDVGLTSYYYPDIPGVAMVAKTIRTIVSL